MESWLSRRIGAGDVVVLGLLLLLFSLYFIPLFTGAERVFCDDIAYVFYPQQVFLARSLARGIVPWWDPSRCAGAMPFFARLHSALYPLNAPCLWAVGIVGGDPYLWLVKVPLALHFFLCAVLAFLLARLGLGLNRPGSAVFAISYALSPTIVYMSYYPPTLFVQAWLPFYCLAPLMFARSGARGWLVLGALGFAVGSSGGDITYMLHVIFIAALFGFGWAAWVWKNGSRPAVARFFVGSGIIIITGGLLAGVYWANACHGLALTFSGTTETVKRLSGQTQSLHPLYLITLLLPDFFGGVTSEHPWGAASYFSCSLNDAQLAGGMFGVALIVLAGLNLERVRARSFPGSRGLFLIFGGILLFGFLATLGAYNPIYRCLTAFYPSLRFPYPIRFRSIQCFAFSGLLGVSAAVLWTKAPRRLLLPVIVFLSLLLFAVTLGLLWAYPSSLEGKTLSGYALLRASGEWSWLAEGALLYAGLGAVGLLALASFAPRRLLGIVLVFLVIGECFVFAYLGLYRSHILNQRVADISSLRCAGPERHPLIRLAEAWKPESPSERDLYRRLYFRSYFSQLALLNQSLSILGFDAKPLDPRFRAAVSSLVSGMPYDLRPLDWNSRFWPNMSVRYVLRETAPPAGLPLTVLGRVERYLSCRLPAALPRLYFQDIWTEAEEDDQRIALLTADLRTSGHCGPKTYRLISERIHPLKDEAGDSADFLRLQRSNDIKFVDFSHPNRIVVDVVIRRPAVLVLTDVWHPDWKLKVAGDERPLLRVNYLQRGIWCEPGAYRIEMAYLPRTVKWGLVLTVLGLGALGAIFPAVRRWRRPAGEKRCPS